MLLLHSSAAPRHLPSFPTRRSSDLVNIDATVVLERPKLRPYIDAMRDRLAKALEIDLGRVSVKATTSERMGFVGVRSEEHTSELQSRGHLVCRLLLEKKKNKQHQRI